MTSPMPMDQYDLKARLYPGLLITLPIFAAVFSIFPKFQHPKAIGTGLFLEFALLFWLMRIARDQGKRVEPGLFARWGGRPTTILLRWSDSEIDPLTKVRYHRVLSNLIKSAFPDAAAESRDQQSAENLYNSAVKALIEKRRGKTHHLIFNENCNYGFARNLYGLRWAGVVSNIATAILLVIACRLSGWHVNEQLGGIAALDVFCTILLATFASKSSVRRAAFAYAHALLRSCDTAAAQRKKS